MHSKLNKRDFKQKSFLKWLLFITTILAITWYLSNYWYQLMLIQGNSMSPRYHSMQLVLLDRHTNEYETGDVIAFQCKGLSSVLVKRIVAKPGDSVKISEGKLYVNHLLSDYCNGMFDYAGLLKNEIDLKDKEYIVIGDNITESKDSRYESVGIVYQDEIIGVVIE